MKMKHIIATLLIVFAALPVIGQNGGNNTDLASLRVAFLTKRLALTPEEAQVFWPVYNAYQDELQALKKEMKQKYKSGGQSMDLLSDSEVEAMVEDFVSMKEKEQDIFRKYHSKFKEVLPIRKVAKLYRTEQDFTRILLQRLNQRKQQMQNRNGGGRPGMRNR